MKKNCYFAFMGKCSKEHNEFKQIQDICSEIAIKYNCQHNGLMRDIDEQDCMPFSGVYIFNCFPEEFNVITKNIKSELENKMYISSSISGTIS